MEVLTLNGKSYVKASKAARDLGYATDYVGQLCRKGSVDAHLVGRTWYVDPNTLGAHRIEKKRNARVVARTHARKAIEESKIKTKNTIKHIAIRYEGDRSSLIPSVRHMEVEGATVPREASEISANDVGDAYTVLNANKKIRMSGDLVIEDADQLPPSTDTVVLKPRIIRKQHTVVAKETKEIVAKPSSFLEKLSDEEAYIEEQEASAVAQNEAVMTQENMTATEQDTVIQIKDTRIEVTEEGVPTTSWIAVTVMLLSILCICVAILSLFIEMQFIYTPQTFMMNFHIDYSDVVNLYLKI
jgi:hypothetical protein